MDPVEAQLSGALALVMRVSRWCGVAPLNFKKNKNGWCVSVSPFLARCGCILIAILNVIAIIGILIDGTWAGITKNFYAISINSKHAWTFHFFLIFALLDAGAFWAFPRMNSMITCLNTLQKVNMDLKLNTFKWYHTSEREKCKFFVLWMIVITTTIVYDFGTIIHTNITNFDEAFQLAQFSLKYLPSYACCFITHIVQMQFVMTVMSILSSFKAVNEKLAQILQDVKVLSSSIYIDQPSSILRQYEVKKSVEPPAKMRKKTLRQICEDYELMLLPPHEAVRQLRVTQSLICDVQRTVDRCYGYVVLLLIASCVIGIIYIPFYFIFDINDARRYKMAIDLIHILWGTILGFNVIILMEPGYDTQREMENTKELVSALMRCTESAVEPLSKELELFYRQLMLHHVVYSPMGITTLTRPVTAGIFSSVLTYLIVLLQIRA